MANRTLSSTFCVPISEKPPNQGDSTHVNFKGLSAGVGTILSITIPDYVNDETNLTKAPKKKARKTYPPCLPPKKKGRVWTQEARDKMAAAQKKRWAAKKPA